MSGNRKTTHPHYSERRRNNVVRIEAGKTKLLCGHYASSHPIAIYPSGRKLYNCPECQTLVKAVR